MVAKKQSKKALYAAAEGMESAKDKKMEMSMAKKAMAKKAKKKK